MMNSCYTGIVSDESIEDARERIEMVNRVKAVVEHLEVCARCEKVTECWEQVGEHWICPGCLHWLDYGDQEDDGGTVWGSWSS